MLHERSVVNLCYHMKFMNDIVANYQAGRTTLCSDDFELIRNWTLSSDISLENANLLTESGRRIMQSLGQRFQGAFPSLLPETYDASRFFFRHTDRQRSVESIRAFAEGIFGGLQNVQFEDIPEVDSLLRVSR